jgi:hypothetical protein
MKGSSVRVRRALWHGKAPGNEVADQAAKRGGGTPCFHLFTVSPRSSAKQRLLIPYPTKTLASSSSAVLSRPLDQHLPRHLPIYDVRNQRRCLAYATSWNTVSLCNADGVHLGPALCQLIQRPSYSCGARALIFCSLRQLPAKKPH